jgi:N-methylhydantoinase A
LGAARLRVMQSNGGALSASEAAHRAITTALSGPAGGIVAAAQIGAQAGFADLLTFDMGGTSTDVALIVGGQCSIVTTGGMGDLPLRTPLLDIHTVGAGGGSLARVDRAGGLRVGPQSAGADPGPVAYGRGETLTVTDANVMLGRLPDDIRLAGRVPLDGSRVRARFEALAHEISRTPEQAALGIVAVANAAMARALRHVSVERGHDPAGLTLLAFGGAGGLHACALASALDMTTILIPRYPGAFSALGLALADVRREYVQALPPTRLSIESMESMETVELETEVETVPEIMGVLSGILADLCARAAADAANEGLEPGAWQWQALLDVRYVGQSFELRTPLTPFTRLDTAIVPNADSVSCPAEFTVSAMNANLLGQSAAAFHALHAQRFGYANAQEPVEVTAVRLLAVGTGTGDKETRRQGDKEKAIQHPTSNIQHRRVHAEVGWCEAAVFQRNALVAGQTFSGPALVLQEDATTYVAPRWKARIDNHANLILYTTFGE